VKRLQPLFASIVVVTYLPLAAIVLGGLGCETGTTGIARPLSPAAEHTITNTITVLGQTGVEVIPAPWGTIFGAATGSILALLAAWQTLTHSRVRTLQTNNNTSKNKNTP
jgi:hypothetical protein